MTLKIILLVLTLGSSIQAFKILVLFPYPSYSHQQPIMALTEKLVQRGHELFVVSPNIVPELKSNSNYTYVNVSFSYGMYSGKNGYGYGGAGYPGAGYPADGYLGNGYPGNGYPGSGYSDNVSAYQTYSNKWVILEQVETLATMVEEQFRSQQFLELQKRVAAENIKFDVVIMESSFTSYTCAIARLLTGNAPFIGMSTHSVDYYAEDSLGSIQHASYVPFLFSVYTDKMSLWQKIDNWFTNHYLMYRYKNNWEEKARTFLRDNYGNERLVDGCSTNMTLTFVTSNHLYFYPRSLTPNVIELGPMHIKHPEKLPKNLQKWLDGAEKGVIYFSLGSNMRSTSLAEEARANFLKFFKQLPRGYRVLWKWERSGRIPGQSNNILAQNWMPQQSILAHPKVKLFITQGGLQSFHETVHYGVPTVGIPWFADQEVNVAKMVDAEIGVRLRPSQLSFENIKGALEKVLYDSRYARNMKKLSDVSRDFTAQSLDKGIFWVEHVARHGGAPHLRPVTADTTYFQYFCLDIISVILGLGFFVLCIVISIVRFLIFKLFLSSSVKLKKS